MLPIAGVARIGRDAMRPHGGPSLWRLPPRATAPTTKQTGWRLVEMETVGAFEAKTHLSSLLERVAKGETFTITRHGTPIAVLSPVRTDDQTRREAAIDRLLTFGKGRHLGMD